MVVGNTQLNGSEAVTGASSAASYTVANNWPGYQSRDTAGTPRTLLWLDGNNNTAVTAGQGGSVRWVNYANSVLTMALDASGNLSPAGNVFAGANVSAGSQVFSTPGGSLYLRGADGNVHIDSGSCSLYVNNLLGVMGRCYIGNWDGGQAFNVGGNILASGYIYNRGSTAYRCWDNGDFNYAPGNYGNYLVQRDASGNFNAGTILAVGRLLTNNYDAGWSNNLGGNCVINGLLQVQGRLLTNGWDAGWSNNLNGSMICNGVIQAQGRLVTNAWDPYGWSNSLGGNLIVQQRAVVNGWDGGYTLSVYGSIGIPDASSVGGAAYYANTGAYWYSDKSNNHNWFTPGGIDDYFHQNGSSGWAGIWAGRFVTQSCVDHAFNLGLRAEPIRNALAGLRAFGGYSYDHRWVNPRTGDPLHDSDGRIQSDRRFGFRPSEVERFFPELVDRPHDHYSLGQMPDGPDVVDDSQFIDMGRMTAVLWEAFRQYMDETESRIAALEAKLAA
jgi:hypothetical protein